MLSVSVVLPNLLKELGTKILSLTYLHTEKSMGVKSDDHGGQATVPPTTNPSNRLPFGIRKPHCKRDASFSQYYVVRQFATTAGYKQVQHQ